MLMETILVLVYKSRGIYRILRVTFGWLKFTSLRGLDV